MLLASVPRAHSTSHLTAALRSDYVNGAAPRACHKLAALAAAEEAVRDDVGNQSAALGRCKCTGDEVKIGLAPHPSTVRLRLILEQQQQLQLERLTCNAEIHSLNSTCDERAAVVAAVVNMYERWVMLPLLSSLPLLVHLTLHLHQTFHDVSGL
jgi:hypothetical protein